LAFLAVGGAVVCWSITSLTIRAGHADPLRFVAWRAWFGVPVLAVVVLWRARGTGVSGFAPVDGVSRRQWVVSIGGAGILFAGSAVLSFAGVNRTALLDNAVISALQPVLVIAAAVVWLGEHADRSHWLRALVALGGTIAVVTAHASGEHHDALGIAFALAAVVVNTGWYLYGRWLRSRFDIDPLAFMTGVLLTVAVVLTPIAWIEAGTMRLPQHALAWSAATMVFGTSAHLMSIWAHRFVPASVSSLFLLAEPPLVGLMAWWAFSEQPAAMQVIGTIVVVVALTGVVRSQAAAHLDAEAEDPTPPA
jgi:drug/metabolite transporter (DMT)-like permease